jgi:hypothetical protein
MGVTDIVDAVRTLHDSGWLPTVANVVDELGGDVTEEAVAAVLEEQVAQQRMHRVLIADHWSAREADEALPERYAYIPVDALPQC